LKWAIASAALLLQLSSLLEGVVARYIVSPQGARKVWATTAIVGKDSVWCCKYRFSAGFNSVTFIG
jgi:hypothetical protein